MESKPWYELLFANYAHRYDNEIFTAGTLGECDFLDVELNSDKTLRLLDVGCGTGRHAIELTRRGYNVMGIDLSEAQLQHARKKAADLKLSIDFRQLDARNLPFSSEFDAAIMLCEGGFPLMETDEMNFAILESVSRALKPKAKFIFTTLNGLFPLCNSINEFHDQNPQDKEQASYLSHNFDLLTFRDYNTTTFTDDSGVVHTLESNERYYIPSEISWILKSLVFNKIDIFGAKLGAYSREDLLTPNDFEMLVIAER